MQICCPPDRCSHRTPHESDPAGGSNDEQGRKQFLVVAAHPPGPEPSYHKIGAPLTGRGMIQIWSLLNVAKKEGELTPPKKNKRGRHKSTSITKEKGKETEQRDQDGDQESVLQKKNQLIWFLYHRDQEGDLQMRMIWFLNPNLFRLLLSSQKIHLY